MNEKYSIYGSELSPYSVKVRSYFRYKEIDHEWIERNLKTQKAFSKLAKIQELRDAGKKAHDEGDHAKSEELLNKALEMLKG